MLFIGHSFYSDNDFVKFFGAMTVTMHKNIKFSIADFFSKCDQIAVSTLCSVRNIFKKLLGEDEYDLCKPSRRV